MRIFELYPRAGARVYSGYDSLQGIVVRARNEKHAREIAASEAGGEGAKVWLNEKKTACDPVTAKGDPGVICRDFYEG